MKIAEELTFLVSHVQETRGIALVEPLLHPLGHLELGHVRLVALGILLETSERLLERRQIG